MNLPLSIGADSADNATERGLLFMLLATLLLASMHSLVRYLGSDLHPFVIVFFRNLFGMLAISPLLFRGGMSSLATHQVGLQLVRAIIGLSAMLSWFYALSKVPIANATALSFSTTIFATLCAWIFLKERMRLRRWAAIFAGLIGVYVVLRPDASGFNAFALLVILSSIAWGSSVTVVKVLSRTDSVTSIVGWMSISLTLLSFPLALLHWQTPTGSQFLILTMIGLLGTAGHLCMTSALKMADTAHIMSVDFLRLVWVSIIGVVWFQEMIDVWTVVGAIIIFTAGWYIIFRESRLKQN